ncbi:hypothetical protein ColKHC_10751 [Colletotrichum higginsianum]|nr:hypothetical protein ColKHC_10751 [Colletotrichum higginsianum]
MGQLPGPPPQWHGAEESMRSWLAAKTEEERRRQEEEKTRQESLRLEQRRIEADMLRTSLNGGIPRPSFRSSSPEWVAVSPSSVGVGAAVSRPAEPAATAPAVAPFSGSSVTRSPSRFPLSVRRPVFRRTIDPEFRPGPSRLLWISGFSPTRAGDNFVLHGLRIPSTWV